MLDTPRFGVLQSRDGGRGWNVIYLCDEQADAEEVMRGWRNPQHPEALLAVCSLDCLSTRALADATSEEARDA